LLYPELIVAIAENGVIGINGKLPWHLPDELKHFKKVTMGRPVAMGRITHESIGKPLSGRINAIISRQLDYKSSGCIVYQNLNSLLDDHPDTIIIGGAQIYKQALPIVQQIWLTIVHDKPKGDTWFNLPSGWHSVWSEYYEANNRNTSAFTVHRLNKS